MKFKKFVLKEYPSNQFPEDLSCFELTNADTDDLAIVEGQAVVKIIWISVDPLLRTWISGAKSYLDPVKPGASIPGFGVGKVVKIIKKQGKKTHLEPNDWVVGMLEWSQYMKCDYSIIQKLPIDVKINTCRTVKKCINF